MRTQEKIKKKTKGALERPKIKNHLKQNQVVGGGVVVVGGGGGGFASQFVSLGNLRSCGCCACSSSGC